VFCSVRNYLRDREGQVFPQRSDAHAAVTNALRTSTDPRRQEIAARLMQLRRRRNAADYEDAVQGLARLTALEIRSAQRIIALLKTL